MASNYEDDLLSDGVVLRDDQINVISKCIAKGSGGINLPMGFGKTFVALELARQQSPDYPVLIIVAKTLIPHWEEHIIEFNEPYYVYHPQNKADCNMNYIQYFITTPEVVSKGYTVEVQRNSKTHSEGHTFYIIPKSVMSVDTNNIIFNTHWRCMIIDEIHNYNSIKAKHTKAMIAIWSDHKWGLSGTIIDNIKTENVMGYNLLIGNTDFPNCMSFAELHIRSGDYSGINSTLVKVDESVAAYDNKVAFEEIVIHHELNDIEGRLYDTYIKILKQLLRELNAIPNNTQNRSIVAKYQQYLMAAIVYIRQFVVSPLIPFSKAALSSSDMNNRSHLSDIINDHIRDNDLQDPLNNADCIFSSRIEACITQLAKDQDRVVIFSDFRVTLDLLSYCVALRYPDRLILTLDGSMSIKKRESQIDIFKNTNGAILMLTYKCGSVGLNLQCSNIVYILDNSWSAVSTKQAIQRVVRAGQTRKCFVYYFTSNLAIEESVFKKQDSKLDKAEGLLSGNSTAIRKGTYIINIKSIIQNIIHEYEATDIISKISSRMKIH